MSIWTHVAATIRFDGIRSLGMQKPNLGKTVDYESPTEDWDKCDVPCGSEGSLQTHFWVNPNASSLAAYTASIFGDLRDYENAGEVIAYLERITDGQMVRNGVATIEIEGQPPVILHYQNEKWNTVGAEPALIPSRDSGVKVNDQETN